MQSTGTVSRNQQLVERFDDLRDVVRKINQTWDDRLGFPPTKIPERYCRNDLGVALQLRCEISGQDVYDISALITHDSLADLSRNPLRSGSETENQFSVFIDNVHVLDDKQGRANRVKGVVRLKHLNKRANPCILNSLYFSFVSGNALFIDWPRFQDGKFDLAWMRLANNGIRKIPHHVVKHGAQVVNDLAAKDGEARRNGHLFVVGDRLTSSLSVVLGDERVAALIKKPNDRKIEILDILVGPF